MLRHTFILLIATVSYFSTQIFNEITNKKKTYSLENLSLDIQPINYNIHLIPSFEIKNKNKFTIDGHVRIKILVKNPVNRLILHSENLTFSKNNCSLKKLNNDDCCNFQNVDFDYKCNQYNINDVIINDYALIFEDIDGIVIFSMLNNHTLPVGNYSLTIKYEGKIAEESTDGVFTNSYLNENNVSV